jgi:hypothetical protein
LQNLEESNSGFLPLLVLVAFVGSKSLRYPTQQLRVNDDDVLALELADDCQLRATHHETRYEGLGERDRVSLVHCEAIEE